MPFVAQPRETCAACGKTLYATEKVVIEDREDKKAYHKTCIRCKECNKPLTVAQTCSLEGTFYCKTHFQQLFKTKGNYDEAFGVEKKHQSSYVAAPASFVPGDRDASATPDKPSHQTSETTQAKFRAFRDEGASNKCGVCDKTVYVAEQLIVEERNERKMYHKLCYKCSVCDMRLEIRTGGSAGGKIYCKNHLKEQNTAGAASYSAGPTSFVPATETASPAIEKKEASAETQAKFRAFRTEGETRKCRICDKTVYAAEEVKAEERGQTFLYHKACFKCQYFDEGKEDGDKNCNRSLDIRTYGSHEAKIYCDTHLKAVAKSNASKWGGQSAPSSFVPASESGSDTPTQQRKETPSHIASKFSSGVSEKCKACGKSVYATEKCVIEERDEKNVYHKNCLRCADCQCKLDMSTYVSLSGVLYCKVHSHERTRFAAQAKDEAYFVSPLAAGAASGSTGSRIDSEQPTRSVQSDSEDDAPKRGRSPSPAAASRSSSPSPAPAKSRSRSPSPAPAAKAAEPEPEPAKASAPADDDEAEFARRKAQRDAERDERKRQQEKEDAERERQRAERAASRETRQSEAAPAGAIDDEIAELEKRRAERAARRAEMEAEAEREAAEAAAKREERRRRLEELKADA